MRRALLAVAAVSLILIGTGSASGQQPDSSLVPTYDEIQQEYELLLESRSDTARLDLSEGQDDGVGLGGLLINEARSPMGTRFYQVFSTNWNPPERLGNYTVVVREQPSPGLGSVITVLLDDEPVFRTRLGPRNRSPASAAERAVQITMQRLAEQQGGSTSNPFSGGLP